MRAFWKYDLFPYILSGTITYRFMQYNKEMVETKEFGKGNYYKPFLILNNKEGKKLKRELEKLRYEQCDQLNKIKDKFQKKLDRLMKEYNHD